MVMDYFGLINAGYNIVLADDVWKVLLNEETISEHALYREAELSAIRHADAPRGSEIPDIRSFSGSKNDERCLEVWFANKVTASDRAWLLAAINEKTAGRPDDPGVGQMHAALVNWSEPLVTNETPPRQVRVTGKAHSTIDWVTVMIEGDSWNHPPGEYRALPCNGFIRGTLCIRNLNPVTPADATDVGSPVLTHEKGK